MREVVAAASSWMEVRLKHEIQVERTPIYRYLIPQQTTGTGMPQLPVQSQYRGTI